MRRSDVEGSVSRLRKAPDGAGDVEVSGPPSELMLFAYGRQEHSLVELDGGLPADMSRPRCTRQPRLRQAEVRERSVLRRARQRARASAPGGRRGGERACLTSEIRIVPKWNTEAASTASAPASTAGGKCSTAPAPPLAITGICTVGADEGEQLEVEAVAGAVGVHRVEQDLARPQLGASPRPLDRVDPGALPAAVGGHLEAGLGRLAPGRRTAGVDREHQHLAAEAVGDLGDQLGAADRGGVDRDLVGAGAQQRVDVLGRPDPAADGERDEDLLGGPGDDLERGGAALVAGGDVEEGQLVGALGVVGLRQLDGVARVAQALEVDALDHPAGVDVQARDHPDGEAHEPPWGSVSSSASSRVKRPS